MKQIAVLFSLVLATLSYTMAQTNEEAVVNAFKKSYEIEKQGNYKKAADELKKVYSEDSYEINLRLGWLTYNAGLFQESASYYQKAVTLKPYSEEARFGLINPRAAQAKWSEVINIYKKILEIDPNNTIANYKLGLIYYGQKKYSDAKPLFEKIVNLYPFDHDGLLMLAWTYYYMGQKNKAKVLFYKTLMNNPYDKSAQEGLSLIK